MVPNKFKILLQTTTSSIRLRSQNCDNWSRPQPRCQSVISGPSLSCVTITTSTRLCSSSRFAPEPEEDLLVEVQNGVRKLTFNRPSKKNAVTINMIQSIVSNLHEGNTDESTTIMVITGQGDYFTSGMDIKGGSKKPTDKESEKISTVNESSDKTLKKPPQISFSTFASSLIDFKKPLIALVNGPALGFGVTMLGLFDAIYASDKATFHTKFTLFGLPPELGSTYTFPRIMGYGKANSLLLQNKKMTAGEAYQCGLVSRVFEDEDFEKETTKLVQEFGQLPLKSLIYSRELVRGREREFLKKVSEREQSFFDPELAREVKRRFNSKNAI